MKYKTEIFIYFLILLINIYLPIKSNQTSKIEKPIKFIKEKMITIPRKLQFFGGFIELTFNTGFQTDTCWYSQIEDKISQVSINYNALDTFPSSFEIQEGQSVQIYFNTNLQDLSYFLSYNEDLEEANIPTECRITDHFKTHIKTIDLSNLAISEVTTTANMFKGYTALNTIYFPSNEMPNLVNIKGMFNGCSSLTSIDLRYLKTSSVTDMSYLFNGCSSLQSLQLSYLETNSVTNMEYMFAGCSSLTSFNFELFSSTTQVQTMEGMFSSCSLLESVSSSYKNTDSLTNMDSMFSNCVALKEINFDDFSIDNVQSMNSVFYKCNSLKSLRLSNWETSNVMSMNNIFSECTSLVSLEIPNFYMQQLMESNDVFNNVNNLRYIDIQNMKYSSTEEFNENTCINHNCNLALNYNNDPIIVCQNNKFITNSNIKEICCEYDIENNICTAYNYIFIYFNHDVNYPTGFKNIYRNSVTFINYNGETLTSTDALNIISNTQLEIYFDESPITMEKFFSIEEDSNMIYLSSIDFSSFSTYELESMDSMFYGCSSLISLDFYFFITEFVINMANLFYGCSSLKSITFSEFFAINVENMDSMFYGCSSLEILNLSSFDTSHVQNMDNMFYNCNSLNLLDISNFIISSTTSTNQMFTGVNNINFINLYNTQDEAGKITSSEINILEKEFFVCQQSDIITNPNAIKCCDYYENEVFCVHIKNITKEIETAYHNIIENIEYKEFKIIKIDNSILQFSTLFEQLNNKYDNISSVDLGDCEAKLREQEGLTDNEQFLIIKLDLRNDYNNATYVQYEIFNPRKYSKVNLDICKNINIKITVPVLMNKEDFSLISSLKNQGYNIFDLNDNFYNDICSTYTALNGADLVLSSRKTYAYDEIKDIYLCQSGCEFEKFNTKTNNSICNCNVQKEGIIIDITKISFNKAEFVDSFYKVLYNSNFRVLKCIQLLFSTKGMKSNYGSYIMTVLEGIFIAFAIIHLIKGPTKIINIIDNIFKSKINNNKDIKSERNKEINSDTDMKKIILNNNLKNSVNDENNEIKIEDLHAPVKKKTSNTKRKEYVKNKINMNTVVFNTKTEEEINKKTLEVSKEEDIKEKEEQEDKQDENNEYENKKTEQYKDLLDEEINDLDYEIAIIIDKRTFWQYYYSLLKRDHLIIFTFITGDDYNLRAIKILLFIVSFSLYFTINAFFFTDESMNNIYEDNGIFNFIFQLPQIIYSSLITTILNIILQKLAISENQILDMKKEEDLDKFKQKAKNIKNNLKIKLIIFLVLSIILMLFCWYFISCFCAVFNNTQLILIGDTLISFLISMIYPFGLKLLPGFFRYTALRAPNKDQKCKYEISRILNIFSFF